MNDISNIIKSNISLRTALNKSRYTYREESLLIYNLLSNITWELHFEYFKNYNLNIQTISNIDVYSIFDEEFRFPFITIGSFDSNNIQTFNYISNRYEYSSTLIILNKLSSSNMYSCSITYFNRENDNFNQITHEYSCSLSPDEIHDEFFTNMLDEPDIPISYDLFKILLSNVNNNNSVFISLDDMEILDSENNLDVKSLNLKSKLLIKQALNYFKEMK